MNTRMNHAKIEVKVGTKEWSRRGRVLIF